MTPTQEVLEAARMAEDERVVKAMPPFDTIKPASGDGWQALWTHPGYRVAAAIRAAAASATTNTEEG